MEVLASKKRVARAFAPGGEQSGPCVLILLSNSGMLMRGGSTATSKTAPDNNG
jgi:hypothetical protein